MWYSTNVTEIRILEYAQKKKKQIVNNTQKEDTWKLDEAEIF